jgi:hypothetical protein
MVGVEGLRAGVTGGVQFEIKPRMSDIIEATCPSSPPVVLGAGVVGLIDGRPPGISEGCRLAESNESVFGGQLIVASAPSYYRKTSLVTHEKKRINKLLYNCTSPFFDHVWCKRKRGTIGVNVYARVIIIVAPFLLNEHAKVCQLFLQICHSTGQLLILPVVTCYTSSSQK